MKVFYGGDVVFVWGFYLNFCAKKKTENSYCNASILNKWRQVLKARCLYLLLKDTCPERVQEVKSYSCTFTTLSYEAAVNKESLVTNTFS